MDEEEIREYGEGYYWAVMSDKVTLIKVDIDSPEYVMVQKIKWEGIITPSHIDRIIKEIPKPEEDGD